MVSWPPPGTRVTVRYRRPAGSTPPLTDAVGHLLDTEPLVRVQTKTGAVVQFAPGDVVAVRTLSDAPVRTSEIRALEHAAAFGWPGVEQQWLDGWLLRAGHGVTASANSAVPLDISATTATIPAIVEWYARRGLAPRLAIADRLLRMPATGEQANAMFVRDVHTAEPDPSVRLSAYPDDALLQRYPRDVLTAVLNGELIFGMHQGHTGRASVTDAPDGTRWVGLSAMQAAGPALCEALMAWGAARGATRGYIRVRDDDHDAASLAQTLGFALHHRARYVTVAT
jgi:hypothetical protein